MTSASHDPKTDGVTQARLEKIKSRIAALRAKASDKACSEAEAMTFAEKAAELMATHGLSEADIRRSTDADFVETRDLNNLRGRRHEVDLHGIGAICYFCDVQVIYHWCHNGKRYGWATAFFGYGPDVELAHFLRSTPMRACETEWAKSRPKVHRLAGGKASNAQMTKARRSFMIGFFQRVAGRLVDIKGEATKTGTALVVVKRAKVDEAFSRKHDGHASFGGTRRDVYTELRDAGRDAGDRTGLHRPVGDTSGPLMIEAQSP